MESFAQICGLLSTGVTAEKRLKHDPTLSLFPSTRAAFLISVLQAYLLIRKLYQTYCTPRHHPMCITNINSFDSHNNPIEVDNIIMIHSHFTHVQTKTQRC